MNVESSPAATTGYADAGYAESLSEFGRPIALPSCGGWLLERLAGDGRFRDAMSCYPLFTCTSWPALPSDLDAVADGLLCVSLVLDPFQPMSADTLTRHFDVVRLFKMHHVVDLATEPLRHVTRHHRYYARRALASVTVDVAENPPALLEDWLGLYSTLVARHDLHGIKAFSRASFERQLRVPGLVMLVARERGAVVAVHLWFVQGGVVYSHLAASSERGYALGASYAIYWRALECFHEQFGGRLRWVDLGAAAGVQAAETGLDQFKAGWANAARPKYFVGRVFNRAAYEALCQERRIGSTDFFPAYRAGEF